MKAPSPHANEHAVNPNRGGRGAHIHPTSFQALRRQRHNGSRTPTSKGPQVITWCQKGREPGERGLVASCLEETRGGRSCNWGSNARSENRLLSVVYCRNFSASMLSLSCFFTCYFNAADSKVGSQSRHSPPRPLIPACTPFCISGSCRTRLEESRSRWECSSFCFPAVGRLKMATEHSGKCLSVKAVTRSENVPG